MASERELVVRAARGDVAAFQVLWLAHRDPVLRFATWMLHDAAAAEDVTQECFLVLLEQPGRFNPDRARLRTFLLAITRNQCRIRWRRSHTESALDDGDLELQSPDSPDDRFATARAAEAVEAVLTRLPPLQREALFLFEYEELSLEEAAAVAGTDVGSFKSRLHRARRRLKRELGWLVEKGI